jgi:hypothetical protein
MKPPTLQLPTALMLRLLKSEGSAVTVTARGFMHAHALACFSSGDYKCQLRMAVSF